MIILYAQWVKILEQFLQTFSCISVCTFFCKFFFMRCLWKLYFVNFFHVGPLWKKHLENIFYVMLFFLKKISLAKRFKTKRGTSRKGDIYSFLLIFFWKSKMSGRVFSQNVESFEEIFFFCTMINFNRRIYFKT